MFRELEMMVQEWYIVRVFLENDVARSRISMTRGWLEHDSSDDFLLRQNFFFLVNRAPLFRLQLKTLLANLKLFFKYLSLFPWHDRQKHFFKKLAMIRYIVMLYQLNDCEPGYVCKYRITSLHLFCRNWWLSRTIFLPTYLYISLFGDRTLPPAQSTPQLGLLPLFTH